MGPVAGRLLGVGRLAMTGRMPNGQGFRLVPSGIRTIVTSTASLDGHDLGKPAPLQTQAMIGDFRIPQRGLVATGIIDFDPFDASLHSSRVVRTSSSEAFAQPRVCVPEGAHETLGHAKASGRFRPASGSPGRGP